MTIKINCQMSQKSARSISTPSRCWRQWPVLVLALALFSSPVAVQAQDEEEAPPDPEIVSLDTSDGVRLRCRWYQGLEEKSSIPIIMVHDWDQDMEVYSHLALEMQKLGHSVIVPDLRGHGGSLTVLGSPDPIDRERMTRVEIASVANDIEACKKFLVGKNDEGLLNIDMLTIVAAGKMCIVAADWAIRDWSWPMLVGRRQGQDVKALVFLSPERSFRGLTISPLLRSPLFSGSGAIPFSVLISCGTEDRDAYSDARRIYSTMERTRPKIELQGETAEERNRELLDKQDLYLETFEVEYQGTNLVHPDSPLDLVNKTGAFLYYRLLEKQANFPWAQRSRDD